MIKGKFLFPFRLISLFHWQKLEQNRDSSYRSIYFSSTQNYIKISPLHPSITTLTQFRLINSRTFKQPLSRELESPRQLGIACGNLKQRNNVGQRSGRSFIHNERQSAFHYALRTTRGKQACQQAGTRLILHPNKPVLAAAINTPCGALFAPIGRPHPYALKLTACNTQPFGWPEINVYFRADTRFVSFRFRNHGCHRWDLVEVLLFVNTRFMDIFFFHCNYSCSSMWYLSSR